MEIIRDIMGERWRRLPLWAKILLWFVSFIFLACMAYYIPPVLPQVFLALLQEFGIGGIVFLILLTFLLVLHYPIISRLSGIHDILTKIAEKLGVRGEEISSPGVVYPDCRWLFFVRPPETDWAKRVRKFYVRCTYPQKLMTDEGCPEDCGGFSKPPPPSGVGAFLGMIMGGLIGLIVGPPGVVLGGLAGGAFGHRLEALILEPPLRKELKMCSAQGLKREIYVEDMQ